MVVLLEVSGVGYSCSCGRREYVGLVVVVAIAAVVVVVCVLPCLSAVVNWQYLLVPCTVVNLFTFVFYN